VEDDQDANVVLIEVGAPSLLSTAPLIQGSVLGGTPL
jgi:hypothetical protein